MSGRTFFSWRAAVLGSDLPATTKLILLALSCHMNDVGESCFPSIKLLMAETSLSKRVVIKYLKEAAAKGWIKISKHGFAGQKWARNEYEIGNAWGSQCDAPGAPPRLEGGYPASPPSAEGGYSNDQKVVTQGNPSTSKNSPIVDDAHACEAVKSGSASDCVVIIEAFDEAREAAFSEARSKPHATDSLTAFDWIEAGATTALIRQIFGHGFARAKATNPKDPPGTLKYFDKAVRLALETAGIAAEPVNPQRSAYRTAYRAWKECGSSGHVPRLDDFDHDGNRIEDTLGAKQSAGG